MTKNLLFIIGSVLIMSVMSPVVLVGFIFGAIKEAFCFGMWLADFLIRRLAKRDSKTSEEMLSEFQVRLNQMIAKHQP